MIADLSCELLSIWLLLWISHSSVQHLRRLLLVVNCFQFDYFCGYHTAHIVHTLDIHSLWIAFNLITFVDITQRRFKIVRGMMSCELLSIWLLLWISHSYRLIINPYQVVVNCFQFDYFCGYHTANNPCKTKNRRLWIAFNLITFVDITQPFINIGKELLRCELLSIWLLLWISHSVRSAFARFLPVVNCFQFDYFCGYHTAQKRK